MPQGFTRRRFLLTTFVAAFAVEARNLVRPLQALAAGAPLTIVIKSLNPKKNMPQIVRTVDAAGNRLIAESPKDLTGGKANTRVTVSVVLPHHPDGKGDPLNKLPFDVKNGAWSIVPGAAYKDGQRCDQDKDMTALAALLQERVAQAQTKIDTPMVCKIDDTRSIGILYRKDWATRADIYNTTIDVTASFKNAAFAEGETGLGPVTWSVDGNQISLSERITDIVNGMKLANPGAYDSDQKRAIAATMLAVAFKEANELKKVYQSEVQSRVDAKGKRTSEAERMGGKGLASNIGDITHKFNNTTDAAPFEAALKAPLEHAVAKLNALLASATPTAARKQGLGSTVALAGSIGAAAAAEFNRPGLTRRAFFRRVLGRS